MRDRHRRTWGFRFSLTDAVALAVFGVTIVVLDHFGTQLAWIVAIVAGHFFFFCNVFRLVRKREIIWASAFVANVGLWLSFGHLGWLNVLVCQLPVTLAVIAWELRDPRYHGIFADRLNPALQEHIQGRISTK